MASAWPPGSSGVVPRTAVWPLRQPTGSPRQQEVQCRRRSPRDEDPVADRERVHVGADLGDEAHGLMAELDTLEAEITVVEVQIRSADRRLLDRHDHPSGPGSRASGTSSIPTDRSARRTAARTAARYCFVLGAPGAASGLGRPAAAARLARTAGAHGHGSPRSRAGARGRRLRPHRRRRRPRRSRPAR